MWEGVLKGGSQQTKQILSSVDRRSPVPNPLCQGHPKDCRGLWPWRTMKMTWGVMYPTVVLSKGKGEPWERGGSRTVGQDADASDLSSCWLYKPGGLFAHRMVFFDHAVKWLQTFLWLWALWAFSFWKPEEHVAHLTPLESLCSKYFTSSCLGQGVALI